MHNTPFVPSFPPAHGVKLTSPRGVTYIIDHPLGTGGKGTVFKAWVANGPDNEAARVIKFPKIDLVKHSIQETEAWLMRAQSSLRNELQASAELAEIDGVAPLLDVGGAMMQFDEQPSRPELPVFFTVSQFVEGEQLGAWAERVYSSPDGTFRGIRNAEQWLGLARLLLAKLDEIHCRRVVHGDIWPDNIMVSADGKLTIIDFGEAWCMSHQLESTSGQSYHPYLAPERYSDMPEGSRWYSSADIYSMGAVLFQLATGCEKKELPSPFQGDTRTLRRGRDLKREIVLAIKARNRTLYEQQPGIADVILMCMRPKSQTARRRLAKWLRRSIHSAARTRRTDCEPCSTNWLV